ncbi:rhomboid protein membrane-associated serine peptidase [Clostridium sp. CAG:1193]|nr:rhomboid protein membrane-associated serine peptidase [Clostridium sp. CAG:1193]
MNQITFNDKDLLVMKLLHYFITIKGYNPIILRGVNNEIWLENMEGPYNIIRINTGYIHNNEQFDFDMFKTKRIMDKIKFKTFSFSLNALSFFLDLGDNVDLKEGKNIDCIKVVNEEDVKNSNLVLESFPDLKDKLNYSEEGVELFSKITEDINRKNMKDMQESEEVFKEKTPYITYTLIIINVLVFISMYIFGHGSEDIRTLYSFGALDKVSVVNYHEYYRLITSAFLHIGFLHLICNMYALYILGSEIESYFGKLKYLFIYFISALVGSLVSLVFISENTISAGASGAIFGLMGALLYFGYYYRAMLNNAITKQIVPLILLNLFIGFISSDINNFAHLGGLFGGLIASMIVGVKYKSGKSEKTNGIIVLLLFIAFLIYMIFFR